MKTAFISDIHGNLEALCAVLEDIQVHQVDDIVCLGDIVGYGPDPEACTDIVMEKASVTLMGNHDYALLHGPENFNPMAANIIYLTQERMAPKAGSPEHDSSLSYSCTSGVVPKCLSAIHSRTERWQFIQDLPLRSVRGDLLLVHASPMEPITEYVFPDVFMNAWSPDRIVELLQSVERLCFCGHTHIPCAIASDLECVYPAECDYRWSFDPGKKYIVNTGSVGQPRDHDNRACYLLYDDGEQSIEWRRVGYDITEVIAKSEAMCGKGNWCAERLLIGR